MCVNRKSFYFRKIGVSNKKRNEYLCKNPKSGNAFWDADGKDALFGAEQWKQNQKGEELIKALPLFVAQNAGRLFVCKIGVFFNNFDFRKASHRRKRTVANKFYFLR